jgi:hypothetical protein
MRKAKAARIAGFAVALGATASLVGVAAGGTGAYFTSSTAGSLEGTSGHLRLTANNTQLNMDGLMPEVPQTQNISYSTDSNGNEDLWMVFDPTTTGYQNFTGAKTSSFDGGLGRYGYFSVSDNGNLDFRSHNLQDAPAGDTADAQCSVNANGDGGSDQSEANTPGLTPLCGVPTDILLASNLPTGSSGNINVTFGISGKAQTQDFQYANVPFKIVATQAGVRPDALNL